MKKFKGLKNFVIGVVVGAVFMSSVALAANWTSINVVLNPFRIRTIMGDVIQWGDNYTLANGTETVGSIVYNDTTYLPIRKVGELLQQGILFDSTTNTITLMNGGSYSGAPYNIPRKLNSTDGNTYAYTVSGDSINKIGTLFISRVTVGQDGFLTNQPNYQRAYPIANKYCYSFEDDGIVFVMRDFGDIIPSTNDDSQAPAFKIMKISYNFDANSADGVVLQTVSEAVMPHQMYGLNAVGIDDGKFIYVQNNSRNNIPWSEYDYNTIDIATGAIHICTPDEKAAYIQKFGAVFSN